jgi:PAS domain S-box-containing protein
MKKFRDFSVKTKLVLMQLLVTSVVLVFLGIFLIYDEWRDYKNSAINQLASSAQLIISNSISSLQFLDTNAAEEVLSSLSTQKDIVNAWIYNSEDMLFAKYSKKGYENYTFSKSHQEGVISSKGYITITKTIKDDEEILGMLSIRLDMSARWRSLLGDIYSIILAFFAGIVTAFLLAIIVQRKISGPILDLTNKTEQVAKTGDYSIRVEEQSSDEIGYLGSSFNKLLEQTQIRKEELSLAREQLQTVLDTVPGTISWLDSDLKYLGVNRRLADTFRLKPEDFIGQDLGFRGSSKEFVEFVRGFFRSKNKQIYKEINATIKDQSYTHLIIGQKYGDDKFAVFIGIDITKIKEAERAIKLSEERFALVLEASNTGIWDFDILNELAYYSPRWKSILGYEENEIENTSLEWEKRLHPDEKEQIIKMFDNYIANPQGQLVVEYRLRHKDGSYRWVYDRSIALLNEQGKSYRILGSIYDITKRKNAEADLQEAHDNLELKVAERTSELEEANIRLLELDRLKSMFLASMSHELRTPLNSIIGFTGLLLMGMAGELNEEQNKQLGLVKNSAKHLLDLINDILDISKIEAEKIDLDINEFNLKDVVNEIIAEASPFVNEKDLKLISDVSHDINMMSDKRRVKQILMNLVSNAIKFTESGSVRVKVVLDSNNMIEFAVMDTGIGITKKDQDKLFAPFQQLDMSSSKKYEGTGLGLYLCSKLVDILGGNIKMSSEPGKGSCFIFTLPLKY